MSKPWEDLNPEDKSFEWIERMQKKTELMVDMQCWVDHFYPDWEPDLDKTIFGLQLMLEPKKVRVGHMVFLDSFVFGISVPTQEAAKAMLAEFKERIEKWY